MIAAIALDTFTGPAAYLTLAGLVAAESMGVPVPGETALLAAAVLAHQGHLALPVVIAVAAVAGHRRRQRRLPTRSARRTLAA